MASEKQLVESTRNFERLSPVWTGTSIVIGLATLGRTVHVARVLWLPQREAARVTMGGPTEPQEGYLVWGDNSGGPIVWVAQADADLPAEVRAVVERVICKQCGGELPAVASPCWLVRLCERCRKLAYPKGGEPEMTMKGGEL